MKESHNDSELDKNMDVLMRAQLTDQQARKLERMKSVERMDNALDQMKKRHDN